jgi:excisionase family DNA binding protein
MKAPEDNVKRYVGVEVEVERTGICERTFRDLVRQGLIPSYRIGRRRVLFVQEEVDRALEARFRREAPVLV